MGGQKGIALFYRSLCKLLPVNLVSVRNNQTPVDWQGEFSPLLGNSFLRYLNPFVFFTIRKTIRKNNSTHLILEHPYYGWLGMLVKWLLGTKLVIHSHNIESLRFKSTGRWWWGILWHYEKMTHRLADINFFITDEDREYAIKHFRLSPKRCHTITYGFDFNSPPDAAMRQSAREQLLRQYQISSDSRILLFNGTLDYKPNLEALQLILDNINPALLKSGLKYHILICGKNLPESFNDLKEFSDRNITYAGFVDDITLFFKGADVFINPVTEGGGIKTKLVEALGYDLSCVSTVSGAIGVPATITRNKMKVVADDDLKAFATGIIEGFEENAHIGPEFYDHFHWNNIARKAKDAISAD